MAMPLLDADSMAARSQAGSLRIWHILPVLIMHHVNVQASYDYCEVSKSQVTSPILGLEGGLDEKHRA